MQLETSKEPAAGAGRQVEQEGDGGVGRALQPRPALQTLAALLAHNHLVAMWMNIMCVERGGSQKTQTKTNLNLR